SFTFSVLLNFFELKKYKTVIVYSNPPILPFIVALANKFFKTKIVFVSYDVYPEIAYITNSISQNGLISKTMKFINKSLFKRVNKVVALSNEMKSFLLENRLPLNKEQVEVIPNWCDDKGKSLTTTSSKNKLFSSIRRNGNIVISYFGNMGVCQELDTIVDAMRELKNDNEVQFVFAGHGIKMGILKSIIQEESLNNVSVFDYLHGQDFQDALNISDCFIVSLADGLTGLAVPSKTYSYMMAGKPVIAIIGKESDIAKDLTENNAGYTVGVGESSKLVNVIKELHYDKEKCEIMGKNCRAVFLEKYTKEKCTQQYVNLIQKILEE
ncbi:glycosyltransferase family 4 protein, partial [Lysinibacillus telephonicus]|uniref:glycosyltransferase family 4 protein n=1 Tax=Lysinibacillus telephonicus TaxID=1714840 RepID=UPI00397C0891